ncbi:MAG: SUMF1/EgtB/PvdO family nonheme iron enzyme [Candidatus Hydrogenedentes bacterium]|nr:SUMF1/EgtB/PvdO family nonheme iron enzyme [Candidatus Hydrogenedentota bacterium]
MRRMRPMTIVGLLFVASLALVGWKCPGSPLVHVDFTGGPQAGHAPLYAQFQGSVSVSPPLVLDTKFRGGGGGGGETPPPPEEEPEHVTIVSWLWSFGDGTTGSGQNVEHAYTEEGCYDVTLTVLLSNGAAGSKTRRSFVCVEAGNRPPVANAGPDQEVQVAVIINKSDGNTKQAGTQVQLDGSESYDPDGDSLTYSWTFLEWPEGLQGGAKFPTEAPELSDAAVENPTFEAEYPGEYVLQLVVDDGQVEEAKVQSEPDTVTITAVVNQPPVADAGDDQTVCVYDETQLDGSGSSDPEDDEITYSWSFVGVPLGSNVDNTWLSNATARRPRFVPDKAGDYTLLLVVSDGLESDADSVLVTAQVPVDIANCTSDYVSFTQGPSQTEIDNGVAEANELDPFPTAVDPFRVSPYEVTNCLFTFILNYANQEDYIGVPVKAFMGGNVILNGQILLQIEDMVGEPEYCDIEWDATHGIFFIARRDGQSMARHPVVEVSWYGALAFCNWLSEYHEYSNMYDLTTWTPAAGFDGYRLPSETEWEFAAAWEDLGDGGQHHIWGFVSSLLLTDISTTRVNYLSTNPLGLTAPPLTTPVGYYDGTNGTTDSVSPWGCYDMSGNVAEWVFEQPYNYEQEGSETKGTSLTSRIIRGGSWQDVANDVRTAFRDSLPQDSTEPTVGFRIVRQSFDCGPEKK